MIQLTEGTVHTALDLEEAITVANKLSREDIPVSGWELSITESGLRIRGRGEYPVRKRGMTTLLNRHGVPGNFANKLNNRTLISLVNNILEDKGDLASVVRLQTMREGGDLSVKGIVSGTYGIMDDKGILDALCDTGVSLASMYYECNDYGSYIGLTLQDTANIQLRDNCSVTCKSVILNSDTASSSLWFKTAAEILVDEEKYIMSFGNHESVSARVIHRGNVDARFRNVLAQFLENEESRRDIIEGKFTSLVEDNCEEITEIMQNNAVEDMKKKGHDRLKSVLEGTYLNPPRDGVDVVTRLLNLKTLITDITESEKDYINELTLGLLW